ncbi:MAG: RraA family protein, partial [Dehalococcoidia bacterium]|nr:RraA family protein [Dehalococcoidia bacterium]
MTDDDRRLSDSFNALDTTCVSDALDRLGVKGSCHGILPMVSGVKAVGPAFTVRYRARGVGCGSVGDFIDDVEPGQVVVIDNGARTYCTVWGDLMTMVAGRRGIAGTVIDGVCRDIPGILRARYPIYTRGRYMATGKDRVELEAVNVQVSISDVGVKPGDIVVCDDSGVVVVPSERAGEVAAVAMEIDETERRMLTLIEQGMTLKEARAQLGY